MSRKSKRQRGSGSKNTSLIASTTTTTPSAQQQQAYYNSKSIGYAPGVPTTPSTLFGTDPHLWQYNPSYNVYQLPRSTEKHGFEKLRSLSERLDAIQMVQQVWADVARGLVPRVVPRPDLIKESGDEAQYTSDILKYERWFSNLGGFMPIHDAMVMALRDQFEIDAIAWYPHKTRGGGMYALELLDGSTLKPLVDSRGAVPEPPYAAYEQYLYGIPQGLYTRDEILYMRETPRSNSMYGMSRVEKFIQRVEMALRKQEKDLARFTHGNLPAGIVEVPQSDNAQTWSPKDLAAFRDLWNNLYLGNYRQQAQARVSLPGTRYTRIDDDPISTEFDQFLLTIACGVSGVTMADLSFTEDVNRSSGESQADVTYKRTIKTSALRYAALFTRILQEYFHESRFIFEWSGYDQSDDFSALATAHTQLVQAGIESVSDAARALKIPNSVEIPRFIIVKGGGVIMVDSLADSKVQDTLLKTLQEPQQTPSSSTPDTNTQNDDTASHDDENAIEDDAQDESDTTKSKAGVA